MRWRRGLLGAAVTVSVLAACAIVGHAAGTMGSRAVSGRGTGWWPAVRTRMPSSPVLILAASAPADRTARLARTLFATALALDPEWKLRPGQRPLRQIGHVDIGEVNSVVRWLAALTARYRLPQKLLVVHQFQLAMIGGERDLDTSHDDLSIVIHMDRQGTPGTKQATWNAVTAAAPDGVFFGWKNFLVKDHPMLTPSQTMTKTPVPVMITHQ
jgi:hypothetical protein